MKISKRKLQAIETKKKIFDAARQLISDYGYDMYKQLRFVFCRKAVRG